MSRSKKNYEVVDDADDDLPSRTISLKGKNKEQEIESTADFDELPNALKFDDEDEDTDEDDLDDEPRRKDKDDEDDADDSDTEGDDDIEDVPNKSEFTKRLMRERRLREEAEQDADSHKRNFDAVNKRLQGIESTLQARTSAEAIQQQENELNSKLSNLRIQKKAAIESGETDQQIAIDEQIADVISDIKLGRKERESTEATAKKLAEAKTEITPPSNRHLTRWMRQHGDSYRTDDEFRAAAQTHDRNIMGEGYDKDSPEYFEELSRRLQKRFPDVIKKTSKREAPERSRHPSSGAEGERTPVRKTRADSLDLKVSGNKVRLNKQHFGIMRSFGMDPESPDDVNTYVRENLPKKRRG